MTTTAPTIANCPGCGTRIRAGDDPIRSGGRLFHFECAAASHNPRGYAHADRWGDEPGDGTPRPTVRGRRKTPLCKDCHLLHTGECP